MKWTLSWLPSAEQDLADIWNNATDRQAVTDAANAIDADLERDPLTQGESREGNTRILFLYPLGIYFDVDQAQQRVQVRAVWTLG